MQTNIRFEKATLKYKETIFTWLEEPFIKEFWDNSQGHKDDILNFIHGVKKPSSYFKDIFFDYWIGFMDDEPYAFIMTHEENEAAKPPETYKPFISQKGKTFGLDFCIGNAKFFGKGLAAPTLKAFMTFFSQEIEPQTDTFIIDPFVTNPRAIHVYQKAGFEIIGEFEQAGGYFDKTKGVIMVKKT